MNSGELHARHYKTGQPVRLSWNSGRIVSLEQVTDVPAADVWIAPPLIDLQINGYEGVDFQQDDVTEEQLLGAVRGMRRDGCTKFLLTLITDDWPRLLERLRRYQAMRMRRNELRQAIIGFHVEGPFLSSKPGFCGAHNPASMRDPTPDAIRELGEIKCDTSLLLTIAPELPGAIEAIRQAVASGFHVNLGHTDATSAQLAAAIASGARGFTHLGNGCPQLLDRHDNILWRGLDADAALYISLIPDGHHVSPELFRLIHRLRGEQIYYTTDAMSAAGAGPGKYRLGKLTLEVQSDGIVRFPGGTNFAGSSLTPVAGVFKAAEMMKGSWRDVWDFFSLKPAERMDLHNSLEVGSPAEFCILQWTAKNHSLAGLQLRTVVPGVEP
jgi:N-acetylglucosamine-6-phosphate deacetylase